MKATFKYSLLIVFSLCVLPFIHVQAEEVAPEQQTNIIQLQENDQTLTGSNPSVETYFEVKDYWNMERVLVNFDYRLTQLSITDQSNITFSINGVKFKSVTMLNEDGEQHLQIDLPKELLKKGANTFKVEAFVVTNTTNASATPADWLYVYKSSNLGLIYQTKENQPAINAFNDRFSGNDNISNKNVAILVPDKANPKELQAATFMLSGYKKLGKENDEIIPLNQLSNATYNQKAYQLIVATYDHLPEAYKKQIDSKEITNDALLKLITTDQQQVLVVTSKNEESLLVAAKFVANQDLMTQVDQPEKIISEKLNVDTPHIKSEQAIQFTKTGDEIAGAGHQSRDYFVQLPSNRSIANNSQIYLEYRYSENLDFDRSLVTVSINGTPIGSQKLSLEHAAGDELTFKIPSDLTVAGDFNVNVTFDLEMKNVDDAVGKSQAPWAYITAKSAMALHTNDRTDLLFENYPFPFLKDGTYNQVAVVLPKEMNDDYYRSLSNVFNLLGKYTQDNTGEITYYTQDEKIDEANLKAGNLIVLGSYQDNQMIQDLNKDLFFQYNDKGTAFTSNEKMTIESGYGQRIGSAQLIRSPYEASKGILVLTGANSENVYLASKEIATHQSISEHPGDAFIVDKNHKVSDFRFKDDPSDNGVQNVTEKIKKHSSLIAYVGLFIFVVAAVIVMLVFNIHKKMKKKEEK